MSSEPPKYKNGLTCLLLQEEWENHREEVSYTFQNVKEAKQALQNLSNSFTVLDRIAHAIEELKSKWVDVAVGKNLVPLDVVKEMLLQQQRAYSSIIKTITLIFSLLVIVLIGLKYLAPHWFV